MEDRNCGNCKHFRLYYTKDRMGRLISLHYGHCVTPCLKKRLEIDKACQHWTEKTQ